MLVAELREHALVIGEVTLTSGRTAQYYVDAKRAILRPEGFAALATLVAAESERRGATAVGGMTMGADAVVCAALAGGAKASGFFVRKEAKAHGLQRRIEGPPLGATERCLVVEDVVTTGGSTLAAIAALKEARHDICGVVSVLDRLAGAGSQIEAAAGGPLPRADDDRRHLPRAPGPHGRRPVDERARRRPAAPRSRSGRPTPEDVPMLLGLIIELAEYERLADQVMATEELLGRALFGERPAAEALIAELDGEPAGYAIYFPTFSTFLAIQGVWLEDLFVRPSCRKQRGRQGPAGRRRGPHPRARRAAPGMVGAGLERPRPGLLPRPRGVADERVDHPPARGRRSSSSWRASRARRRRAG